MAAETTAHFENAVGARLTAAIRLKGRCGPLVGPAARHVGKARLITQLTRAELPLKTLFVC